MFDRAQLYPAIDEALRQARKERDDAGGGFMAQVATGQAADALIGIKWELTAIRMLLEAKADEGQPLSLHQNGAARAGWAQPSRWWRSGIRRNKAPGLYGGPASAEIEKTHS
jgi:hypothetical protein